MKRLALASIFLALMMCLVLPVVAWATSSTFNNNGGSGDGNWGTSTNWTNGIPTSSVAATIAANCNVNTAATCQTLTLNSGITFSGSSALTTYGAITNNGATISYTGNVTINSSGTDLCYFGGTTWSGTVTINQTSQNTNTYIVDGTNTFGNLTVDSTSASGSDSVFLTLRANQTITGALTLKSYCSPNGAGSSIAYSKPLIWSGHGIGSPNTLTVNGSIGVTGALDFEDITGAGTASWNLSGSMVGNCGGCSGITFRSPQTFYLVLGASNGQFYGNGGTIGGSIGPCFATSSGGSASYANVPLPQDTVKIDNNTWGANTGYYYVFHASTRACNIDASGLTNSGNTLAIPAAAFGNVDFSGSGCAVYTGATYGGFAVCPRVKNEGSTVLTINIPWALNSNQTIYFGEGGPNYISNGFSSCLGTVKLLSNLNLGTAYLNDSGLDLNGKTITCQSGFNGSSSLTRTLKDTAGGGNITLLGTSGNVFDTTTSTGMTVSNAPSIQIGNAATTQTGDVTFVGSGFTYGNFTVKKHAGNYSTIVTGANTFGAVTLQTPDATYNYSNIKFTAGTTTTLTGFSAVGTSLYTINIQSATSAAHTLSCASGTISVKYCTITYSHAGGGATWNASVSYGNVNGGNDTGWNFNAIAGGLGLVF